MNQTAAIGDCEKSDKMRVGFFAYPWDLRDEGVADAIRWMAERAQCNAIALNAVYHHARVLRPRARGVKTLQLSGAVAAFEPNAVRYERAGLLPVPYVDVARANVLAQAREACTARGMDLGLWIVALHNSTLGETHPDLCIQNCFGDVYTYALCPTQPRVQAYVSALVDDVCAQFQPQRLLLEAIGYLGMRHGVHHELFMIEWAEPLELLLGICFCPACMRRAQEAAIDVDTLRTRVAAWAHQYVNEERVLPLEATYGETASLLVEIPQLWTYLRVCSATVAQLVRDVCTVAQRYNVALEVIPSSFHRPAARAWLERAPFAELDGTCDGLIVLAYCDSAAQVSADLRWATALARQTPIVAGLNACAPNIKDDATLVAQARAAREANCAAVYYYNYGLLSSRRLEWVARANTMLIADD